MHIFNRLLKYVKPYIKYLIMGGVCIILSSAVSPPALLAALSRLFDQICLNKDAQMLNLLVLATIGIFLFNGLATYGHNYLISKAGQKVIMDLRCELYSHLQFLSLSFFEKRKTGQIMSRITNDVGVLQFLVTNGIIDLITSSLRIVVLVGYIFIINWKLALVTLIGLPAMAYTFAQFSRKIRKVSTKIQEKIADVNDILQETLSAIKIVQSFVQERREIKRFWKKSHESYRATMKGIKLSATLTPLHQFIGGVGLAIALWFGGHEVIRGSLSPGEFIAFMAAVGMLGVPVNTLTRINTIIQHALACGERIFEILDMQPEIKEEKDALEMPEINGNVQFNNVSFAYESNEKVLSNINLEIKPGEVVALVGPSGSGKTTLVNLLLRFYDPTEGEIFIDGINIKKVKLTSLRRQLGIVPQETILFGGTVQENISYGKMTASEKEIIDAAKLANAHEFITKLPEGYNSIVGERGVKLSGGERQRIAIARAMLKDPRILILDEATSSLDTASEAKVQEALERLMYGRTTLIIAHRLSTIRHADKILVIDKGKIVEQGTHKKLLENKGLYYKLYHVQKATG